MSGNAVFSGFLLLSLALTGCKKETIVDKQQAAAAEQRVAEEKQAQKQRAKGPEKVKAMNWRVIAIASSFASIGRSRIDALGDRFEWKVNVFEETGDNGYDRVELDKDRDGKVDETWRSRNGRWEKFDGRLFWSGTEWVQAGAGQVELPKVSTRTDGGEPLHKAAIEMLQHKAVNYEVADFLAGHGPRISLHDDDWDARWDRADVDRDRDGAIDEKWTRKGDVLTREVLADKRSFTFRDNRWVEVTR